MGYYAESAEKAIQWKQAVERLWRNQRTVLLLSIATLVLVYGGMGILYSTSTAGFVVAFAMIGLGIAASFAIYIVQWIFFARLKAWANVVHPNDKGKVKLFYIAQLITLIVSAVMVVCAMFSAIPIVNIIALGFISIASLGAFAAIIMQFVAIARLRNSDTLPAKAARGVKSLFWYYIVYWCTYIIGYAIFIIGFMGLYASLLVNINEFDNILDDPTAEYYFDNYDNDEYDSYSVEDEPEFGSEFTKGLEEMKDANGLAFHLLTKAAESNPIFAIIAVLGYVFMIIGAFIAMVFYYRGWWLISKSELEIRPEPTNIDAGEYVPYVESEPTSAVELDDSTEVNTTNIEE